MNPTYYTYFKFQEPLEDYGYDPDIPKLIEHLNQVLGKARHSQCQHITPIPQTTKRVLTEWGHKDNPYFASTNYATRFPESGSALIAPDGAVGGVTPPLLRPRGQEDARASDPGSASTAGGPTKSGATHTRRSSQCARLF